MSDPSQLEAAAGVARRQAGLRALVLFGSRARGDERPGSDWDFGYLGTTDPDSLSAGLMSALGADDVQVVDLERASGLLRFRAARDGLALHEDPSGVFAAFQFEAARFWCDAGPILERAYQRVLADYAP